MAKKPIIREFHSWGDFVDAAADNSPRFPATKDTINETSRMAGNRSHMGTDSFEEAIQLARMGWPEGREKLTRAIAKLPASRAIDRAVRYDVAGERFDLGRAIAGDPACMMGPARASKQARPIVRIDVNVAYGAETPGSAVINYGAAIVSVIDAIENAGHSVELRIIRHVTRENNPEHYIVVTVKAAGDPLDLDIVAFALINPATNRRLGWSVFEREMDFVGTYYESSYGAVDRGTDGLKDGATVLPRADHGDVTPAVAKAKVETLLKAYLE